MGGLPDAWVISGIHTCADLDGLANRRSRSNIWHYLIMKMRLQIVNAIFNLELYDIRQVWYKYEFLHRVVHKDGTLFSQANQLHKVWFPHFTKHSKPDT